MNNLESFLKQLKKVVTLSSQEKDVHREAVRAFVRTHPQTHVPSPYSFIFTSLRYAVVALLIVSLTGSGVAYAAERSLPGSPLYIVKAKVTEPARVALTQNPEKRAELEVELIERRLKEVAKVSSQKKLTEETAAFVASVLDEQLEDVQEDLRDLSTKGARATKVLSTSRELETTLEAHSELFEELTEQHEGEGGPGKLSLLINEAADESREITLSLEEDTALLPEEDYEVVVQEEEKDIGEDILEIAEILEESGELLDTEDQEVVSKALLQAQEVAEAAEEKKKEGSHKEALRLYGEMKDQIIRLKVRIDADRELGIELETGEE